MEYLFLIPRSLQNLRKALLSNCNPLSDIRDSSIPNLVIMLLHTNFLTSTSRILANASASAHLVKLSTATITNLRFPVDRGNEQTMSSPHCVKGHGLLIGFRFPCWLMNQRGMLLTLDALPHIFGSILLHLWPPKPLGHSSVCQ